MNLIIVFVCVVLVHSTLGKVVSVTIEVIIKKNYITVEYYMGKHFVKWWLGTISNFERIKCWFIIVIKS